MAPLATERIRPGFRGQDLEAAPEYVADGAATYLENLLPGRNGKLVPRGALTVASVAQPAAPTRPYGFWTYTGTGNPEMRYGYNDGSSQCRKVAMGNSVFTTTTVTVAQTTPIPYSLVPGRGNAELGDYSYGINWGPLDADRGIVRWSPSAPYLLLTNGPHNARDVVSHLDRLFVLGGYGPGVAPGPSSDGSSLWWSDAGGPTADTLAMWQDDASGLVNEVKLRGDNDSGIALAKCGRNLAILRTGSIYLLTGQTPSSFSLQRVSDRGCRDMTSVVEYGDGFFFMSYDGYYYFDGVTTREVSGPIRTAMCQAISSLGRPSPEAHAVKINNEYLLVTVATTDPTPLFSAFYHIPSGGWSYFSASTSTLPLGQPIAFTSMLTYPYTGTGSGDINKRYIPFIWDGRKLWHANSLALPEQETLRGNDVTAPFAITYRSRVARLATPQLRAQLHRLLMDFRYQFSSGVTADSTTDGWQVSLVGGDGTTLMAVTASGARGSLSTATTRQRARFEVTTEAEDVQLVVTRLTTGNGANPFIGEIQDAWAEFQASRQ